MMWRGKNNQIIEIAPVIIPTTKHSNLFFSFMFTLFCQTKSRMSRSSCWGDTCLNCNPGKGSCESKKFQNNKQFIHCTTSLFQQVNSPRSKTKESDKVWFPSYPPWINILCLGRTADACQLRGDGNEPVMVGLENSIIAVKDTDVKL